MTKRKDPKDYGPMWAVSGGDLAKWRYFRSEARAMAFAAKHGARVTAGIGGRAGWRSLSLEVKP